MSFSKAYQNRLQPVLNVPRSLAGLADRERKFTVWEKKETENIQISSCCRLSCFFVSGVEEITSLQRADNLW